YVSGPNIGASSRVKVLDLDTGTEAYAGDGFWPTWSADGTTVAWFGDGPRLASTDAVLSGDVEERTVQPTAPGHSCQDNTALAGQAICSPASWSPDARWVYGPDMVGQSVVALPVAGGTPI